MLVVCDSDYAIRVRKAVRDMTLVEAMECEEYIIRDIATYDEELNAFLFSLGCYSGELITVVAKRKNSMTVAVKDGRYNIDTELASAILV